MNARDVLSVMVRTDRGDMTVWSPQEAQNAIDAYRTEVLREALEIAEQHRDAHFKYENYDEGHSADMVARGIRKHIERAVLTDLGGRDA